MTRSWIMEAQARLSGLGFTLGGGKPLTSFKPESEIVRYAIHKDCTNKSLKNTLSVVRLEPQRQIRRLQRRGNKQEKCQEGRNNRILSLVAYEE